MTIYKIIQFYDYYFNTLILWRVNHDYHVIGTWLNHVSVSIVNSIGTKILDQVDRFRLQIHKITLLDHNLLTFKNPAVNIRYTEKEGSIVTYDISINQHKLELVLLNINKRAEAKYSLLGSGSYGEVRIESITNKKFVVKRQYFKISSNQIYGFEANREEIEEILIQYGIHKICSVYRIGPAVDTEVGFDCICYDDCMEFHLELCEEIDDIDNKDDLEPQLKQCIYALHRLKIVHKDVKPANFLYSRIFNKFVISDFGISHPIKQNVGQQTYTYFEGTPKYMSEQMKSIKMKGEGYVNLYENDRIGLQNSIKFIKATPKLEMCKSIDAVSQVSNNNDILDMREQCKELSNYNYQLLKIKFMIIKQTFDKAYVQSNLSKFTTLQIEELLDLLENNIVSKGCTGFIGLLNSLNNEFIKQRLEKIRSKTFQIIQNTNPQIHFCNFIRVYCHSDQTLQLYKTMGKQLTTKYAKFQTTYLIQNKKIGKYEDVCTLVIYGKIRKYKKILEKQIAEEKQISKKIQLYLEIFQRCQIQLKKDEIDQLITSLCSLSTQDPISQMLIKYISAIYRIDSNTDQILKWKEQIMLSGSIKYRLFLLNLLVLHYSKNGDWTKAYQSCKQLLQISIQYYGHNSPRIVNLHLKMACQANLVRKSTLALMHCETGYQMMMRLPGHLMPESLELAEYYKMKHEIHQSLKEIKIAVDNLEKYLKIKYKLKENKKSQMCDFYYYMAKIEIEKCNYLEGERLLLLAIETMIEHHKLGHYKLQNCYSALADLYFTTQRYLDCIKVLIKNGDLYVSYYGQRYFENIMNNVQLAQVYREIGQLDKAQQLINNGIQVYIQQYPQEKQLIVITLLEKVRLLNQLNKVQEALSLIHYCYEFLANNLHEYSDCLGIVYSHHVQLLRSRERFEQSIEWINKSMQFYHQYNKSSDRYISDCYYQLARIFLAQSRYEESQKYCLQSLEIRKDLLDQNHYDVARCYCILYSVTMQKRQYASAIQFMKIVEEKYSRLFQGQNIRTSYLYFDMCSVYLENKQPQLALKYGLKAKQILSPFQKQENYKYRYLNLIKMLSQIYFILEDMSNAVRYLDYIIESVEKKFQDIECFLDYLIIKIQMLFPKKYQLCREPLSRAFQILTQNPNLASKEIYLHKISAQLYFTQKKYQSSLQECNLVQKLITESKQYDSAINILLLKITIYQILGPQLQLERCIKQTVKYCQKYLNSQIGYPHLIKYFKDTKRYCLAIRYLLRISDQKLRVVKYMNLLSIYFIFRRFRKCNLYLRILQQIDSKLLEKQEIRQICFLNHRSMQSKSRTKKDQYLNLHYQLQFINHLQYQKGYTHQNISQLVSQHRKQLSLI